jgi:hypothetical protein
MQQHRREVEHLNFEQVDSASELCCKDSVSLLNAALQDETKKKEKRKKKKKRERERERERYRDTTQINCVDERQ